jgi:hypothetical protein
VRYILLYILLIGVVAARPACDARTPGVTPAEVHVQVEPDSCTELVDPRGLDWADLAGISLSDTFASVWLRVERRPQGNTVFVCADEDVPLVRNQRILIRFTSVDGRFAASELFLDARSPLSAAVSASPDSIYSGETSQLEVVAAGGVPPYTYDWISSGVSDPTIPNPTVSEPGRYRVYVRDSVYGSGDNEGHYAFRWIDVKKKFSGVAATATPDTIEPGGQSDLAVSPRPRTAGWLPTTGLDDPFSSFPTTTLQRSLTYSVYATFDDGDWQGTVRVTVRMHLDVTATPIVISEGDTARLDVTVVAGGYRNGGFRYNWHPSATLDDPSVSNPRATPSVPTTYFVDVVDTYGQLATDSVRVVVLQ